MAKTPLFGTLQKALRLASTLETRRLSTPEGWERLEEAGATRAHELSRRDFLKLSAGAAGAAVLPKLDLAPELSGSLQTTPRIVIVGAGLAGLTTAYRLQLAKFRPVVYEANRRVGGRVFTNTTSLPGRRAELGGEFIDTGHEAIRALAKELRLTEVDMVRGDGTLVPVYFFGGKRYELKQIVEDFRPVAAAIKADVATLKGDDVTATTPNGGESLDKLSISAWLESKGISGTIRQLIEVAYQAEYGAAASEQSVFNLLYLIGTEDNEFTIYGESDERYHLRGGNETLITALNQRLTRGTVNTEQVLEAVRPSGTGYTLTFRKGATATDVPADVVIFALPFSVLRDVDLSKLTLSDGKVKAIRELGYGTNTKVIAGMRERVWRKQGSNGESFSDLPYQQSYETIRYQSGTPGAIVNFTGGQRGIEFSGSREFEYTEQFLADLEKVYPGVTKAWDKRYVVAAWPMNQFARGSYSFYKPGQWTGIRGFEGTAEGKLFFAGEHTSLDYQGYMNGAVESGERVAKEVIAALK